VTVRVTIGVRLGQGLGRGLKSGLGYRLGGIRVRTPQQSCARNSCWLQVENEYGFCGSDRTYLRHLVATARRYLGPDVILYTTDPPPNVARGSLPGDEVYTCAASLRAQPLITLLLSEGDCLQNAIMDVSAVSDPLMQPQTMRWRQAGIRACRSGTA